MVSQGPPVGRNSSTAILPSPHKVGARDPIWEAQSRQKPAVRLPKPLCCVSILGTRRRVIRGLLTVTDRDVTPNQHLIEKNELLHGHQCKTNIVGSGFYLRDIHAQRKKDAALNRQTLDPSSRILRCSYEGV